MIVATEPDFSAGASGIASSDGVLSAFFEPLGIPLIVEADRPELIHAVAIACAGWEAAAEIGTPALQLRLELGAVANEGRELKVRVEGASLNITGDVEAEADAGRGRARCRVASTDVFLDPVFRERVLDCLILWLVTRSGRTPLHASAFVADELAVLLAGPSGSGKSCLAWAAHKAGLALLSEDTVYVELRSSLRFWGIPRPIHLFPEDAPTTVGPLRMRNGKRKHAVSVPSAAAALTSAAAVLCILSCGERVSLEPVDQEAALAALDPLEPGFSLLEHDIRSVLARITRHGAWRLTLGSDPDDAIHLLTDNLARLAMRAAS
jgi:hypothetical protein